MRAMIVDDEAPALSELIYLLSRYGAVEIAGAFTASATALEAAQSIRPDVFFLDLSMPRMNGAELARKILAQIPTARIVFVTAFAKELEGVKGIPAFGSLLKPVNSERLDELMEQLRA
ncbi:MAG: response regulator [Firmicutes bacterium]|jgi:DNA-binding LytR/AlgR family response regulator|nr:response regulator [Bacillota bacterium]